MSGWCCCWPRSSSARSLASLRRQRAGPAADPRPARLLRHGGRVLPVRDGDRRHPVRRPGRPQRHHQADGRHRRGRARRRRGRRPHRLCQRGLSRACRRATAATDPRPSSACSPARPEVSEAIYRLAQAAREQRTGARGDPPVAVRSTGAQEFGWYRVRVRPLAAPERPHGDAVDRSPTSPTSASARRTSSRSSSTRSTISTMRRPASSRSIPTAPSST